MSIQNQNLIKKLTNEALSQIERSMSSSLTDPEAGEISKIIEDKLVKAAIKFSKSRPSADVICFSPDSNIVHKISKEMDIHQSALIANLSSMR